MGHGAMNLICVALFAVPTHAYVLDLETVGVLYLHLVSPSLPYEYIIVSYP